MNFLNKLEKKYRKYAIPNLMYYIVMLYGAGLVIQLFAPMAYWTDCDCAEAGAGNPRTANADCRRRGCV